MIIDRQTLLIVAAHSTEREQLQQQLIQLGYGVALAETSRQALDHLRTNDTALVLLGENLALAEGLELLQRLQDIPQTPRLPVICLATASQAERIEQLIAAGAADYIGQPYSTTLLQARLQLVLDQAAEHAASDAEIASIELLKYERELQIGQQIQADFLPNQLPNAPGWEIAAYFEPAREVAGDFYDAFTLTQNRRIGLLVADVCDKGVGAALFMALFRSLLRAFAGQRHSMSWADVLDDTLTGKRAGSKSQRQAAVTMIGANALKNSVMMTNAYMVENHRHARMYATLFFGILDPSTGSLIYINGGHNPPLLVGPEGVKETLDPTGPVVGVFPEADYGIEYVQLDPHDVLFCYTDGIIDAKNTAGTFFTEKRLFDLVTQPTTSANDLLERVRAQVLSHIADAPQFDDITMMAVRRTETKEQTRRRRSTRELIQRVLE